jgi:hypothetical protein
VFHSGGHSGGHQLVQGLQGVVDCQSVRKPMKISTIIGFSAIIKVFSFSYDGKQVDYSQHFNVLLTKRYFHAVYYPVLYIKMPSAAVSESMFF